MAVWSGLDGVWVWGMSSPVAMAYVYYGVMGLRRGVPRLVASLPLLAFYYRVGYELGTVFERAMYSFFFIWLTSWKVALLCWDQGPVADPWAVASFPRFLAVMNLSLHIKRQQFSERFTKSTNPRALKAPLDQRNGNHRDSQNSNTSTRNAGDHHLQSLDMSTCNGGDHHLQSLNTTHNAGDHQLQSLDMTARDGGHQLQSLDMTARDGDHQLQSLDMITRTTREVFGRWMLVLFRAVEASQEMSMVVMRLVLKFVCFGVIVYSYRYRDAMHVGVVSFAYSLGIYVSCSIIFEGIAAVVSPMMGIELEAAFNKPFLAHSLADFWGRRWNLLVSNLLRVSVHDPVLRVISQWSHEQCRQDSTLTRKRDLPLWPRSVATFACFLGSGLMHELIFYNMTRSKPTWEVTFFFILNGAATVLEGAIRQTTRLRFPKLVSIPLTLSFVLATAIWWFYPPLVDSGAVDDSVAECTYFFQRLHELVAGS